MSLMTISTINMKHQNSTLQSSKETVLVPVQKTDAAMKGKKFMIAI